MEDLKENLKSKGLYKKKYMLKLIWVLQKSLAEKIVETEVDSTAPIKFVYETKQSL